MLWRHYRNEKADGGELSAFCCVGRGEGTPPYGGSRRICCAHRCGASGTPPPTKLRRTLCAWWGEGTPPYEFLTCPVRSTAGRRGRRPLRSFAVLSARGGVSILSGVKIHNSTPLYFGIVSYKIESSYSNRGCVTPLFDRRRQMKRRKIRCGWRCGSVETCRKAARRRAAARLLFAEAEQLQSRTYGKGRIEGSEEGLSQHREEEKDQKG